MRTRPPFDVFDDPFLDIFSLDPDTLGQSGTFAAPPFASAAVPPVQDPDVEVPLVPPGPAGGPPIADPDVVIPPRVDPPADRPPVQDAGVIPAAPAPSPSPLIAAYNLADLTAFFEGQGALATPHDMFDAAWSQLAAQNTNAQQAVGAVPPVQDPDIDVPPVDPSPSGGPSVADPTVVIPPRTEPPIDHFPIQDVALFPPSLPAFVSPFLATHSPADLAAVAPAAFALAVTFPDAFAQARAAVPADWWLVSWPAA